MRTSRSVKTPYRYLHRRSGTRFPYPNGTQPSWAFNETSVWNLGIGSNVLYTGASGSDPITATLLSETNLTLSTPGSPPGTGGGEWTYPLYVGGASDTTFSWTGMSWPGQTRPSGSVQVPSNAVVSSDSDVLLLLMDSTRPTLQLSFYDTTTLNRSSNTVSASYGCVEFDTSNNGLAISGQGNHHPPLQGADLDNITNGGGIYRMLPCHIHQAHARAWGSQSGQNTSLTSLGFYNCVWPAIASDSSGGTGTGSIYTNSTAAIPFGSILFIPKGVLDMTGWSFGGTNPLGLSQGGMALALQLQNYGLHVENTGGSFMIYTSWDVKSTSPRTTRWNEIQSLWNGGSLLQYMRVMKNWMMNVAAGATPTSAPGAGYQYDPNYNPSAPINGGGTYPPRPPLWDSSLGGTFVNK